MLQVVIQVAKTLECGAVIKYNWEFTQFVFSDPLQSPPVMGSFPQAYIQNLDYSAISKDFME